MKCVSLRTLPRQLRRLLRGDKSDLNHLVVDDFLDSVAGSTVENYYYCRLSYYAFNMSVFLLCNLEFLQELEGKLQKDHKARYI